MSGQQHIWDVTDQTLVARMLYASLSWWRIVDALRASTAFIVHVI